MEKMRLHASKDEMCRVIHAWIVERCRIPHARVENLSRLTIEDLQVILLAIRYKLDKRDVDFLTQRFEWQWKAQQERMRPRPVAPLKAISHDKKS